MESFVADFGEPEEVQNFDDDEELSTTVLHYWKEGLSAFFVGLSGPILAGLEIDHPDVRLFNKKIIGITEEELIDFMKQNGYKNFEIDFEDSDKRLSYDVGMMDFFFRNNKLIYMNFGVLVDENGNIETV
jgi:hypothetical protein